MQYEVDFLAVGKESQSGDAIALRYGNFTQRDTYRIVVIDGGFKETGEDLVRHICNYYDTSSDPRVDLVISTHPDIDHASGLRVVLSELVVGELWMHKPWEHSSAARAFTAGRRSALPEVVHRSIDTAKELESLAKQHDIPIVEPFEGVASDDGVLRVIAPSTEYYEELLAEISDQTASLHREVRAAVRKVLEVIRALRETWNGEEALVEPGDSATSPRNQTSTIILADLYQDRFLFTGDAGVEALERSIEAEGGDLNLTHLQIPHHGSKRNVGPSILDVLLGPIQAEQGTITGKRAIISCAKNGNPKHPSRRVTNASIRRGAKVFTTQGSTICSSNPPAERDGWVSATPEEFTENYED